MYYDDHGIPHFHADYAGAEVSVAIESLAVLKGTLPGRERRLVLDWASLHRDELMENWRRARQRQSLLRVDPLE